MLGADEMARVLGELFAQSGRCEESARVSEHADLRGLPPVLMVIPECDILTEQNWRLAKQLEQAGARATTVVL